MKNASIAHEYIEEMRISAVYDQDCVRRSQVHWGDLLLYCIASRLDEKEEMLLFRKNDTKTCSINDFHVFLCLGNTSVCFKGYVIKSSHRAHLSSGGVYFKWAYA